MLTKTITPLQRLEFAFQLKASALSYDTQYALSDSDVLYQTESLIKAAGFIVEGVDPSDDEQVTGQGDNGTIGVIRYRFTTLEAELENAAKSFIHAAENAAIGADSMQDAAIMDEIIRNAVAAFKAAGINK